MVQQVRKSITALGFFLISLTAAAQPIQGQLALKPDAPDRYIVVPGDTLWGISQRYTDSPWRWPELWNMNKDQIRNPHLIYPGYVILLDRARGQLSISRGETGQAESGTATAAPAATPSPGPAAGNAAGIERISPKIRSEALAKEEIPSIPPGIIEPFLKQPLVIEPDGLDKAPTIVGTQQDRVILSAGNAAYVRGIANSKEDNWYVYRKGVPLVDPDTNQTLGYEAIYLGTAQVTRTGDPATVVLSSAVQEVGPGDKLVPAGTAVIPNYAPHAPGTQIRGRVMSIYGGLKKVGEAGQYSIITINRGRSNGLEVGNVVALYSAGGLKKVGEAGQYSIITINRGRSNGLEVGNVVALYSAGGTARDVTTDRPIKLPDERAGLAFVFRVFDRISYALVMYVTRPINTLDVVQNP